MAKNKSTKNKIGQYTTDRPLEEALLPVGISMLEVLSDPAATKDERDMAISTIKELLSI